MVRLLLRRRDDRGPESFHGVRPGMTLTPRRFPQTNRCASPAATRAAVEAMRSRPEPARNVPWPSDGSTKFVGPQTSGLFGNGQSALSRRFL